MNPSKRLKSVKDLPYDGQTIQWFYDDHKVSHLKGEGERAMAYSLGFVHARERGLQLLIFQALIRGKLSQWLKESIETLETDRYLLKMGFYYQARKEEGELDGKTRDYLQSYIEGINQGLRKNRPFEANLLKMPIEPWTLADTLALIKIMTYFGLAQTQQDFEKFISMALGNGVAPIYFKSLFPKFSQSGIEESIPFLQKAFFDLTPLPKNQYTQAIPNLKASNNWVLSPSKTETGKVQMAADPHLEINRLPAIWFEATWTQRDHYLMGITLPGVPGFIMGRNENVSFSFSYGYMDTVDYFIEEVKDSQVREEHGWTGISLRKESFPTKANPNGELRTYETERGYLEVPEDCYLTNDKIKDGIYLSRAWTCQTSGAKEAIDCLRKLITIKNVDEACDITRNVFFSANWLFGDVDGNIAYQQSGYFPMRSGDGIYPLKAWEKANHWQPTNDNKHQQLLTTLKNPECGFLATANHNVQKEDEPIIKVNLPMADYRFNRINSKLESKEKLSLLESKTLHSDLFSPQASAYLELIKEDIPDTPSGRILSQWDLHYNKESLGAFLFEEFLKETYQLIFSPIFGGEVWNELSTNSTLVADFYGVFDRILLSPQAEDFCWFEKLTNQKKLLEQMKEEDILKRVKDERDQLLRVALSNTLRKFPLAKLKAWGEVNTFTFSHLLFYEDLPAWLPWNKGPYAMQGCRATICQGNLYKDRGRQSSYAPSYRMVTDMGTDCLHTVLPGGPSDRFFKKSYASEINNYLNFKYKTLLPN